MSKFYDGTKLLSMLDIHGKKPEIFICTSNRSAGKTTYFNRWCVNRFLKYQEKFMIVYRFNYELDDCASKFFKDIQKAFFPNMDMQSKRKASGIYHELFLDDVSCGYAISLNSADQLKKYSHFFSDTTRMIFDEFQSETNHYASDEVKKLISIHTSVARGSGKQSRYVPVIMISNPVTILNPYYVQLGISNRLKKDTKFLRGNGFVLEQGYNESASTSQAESAFNQAFSNSDYIAYSSEGVYLNDIETFIEKPVGKSKYLATIRFHGKDFAIREYMEDGILYCDTSVDYTSPNKLVVTTNDHNVNFVMLKRHASFLELMRYYFENGCFRFRNLECKDAILTALAYI